MAANLISNLDLLDAKIRLLAQHVKSLEERNAFLETKNAELILEIQEARADRDRALQDAEFMAVSHRLADNPDSLVSTRRHIAGLIRNIDRCLDMLKE